MYIYIKKLTKSCVYYTQEWLNMWFHLVYTESESFTSEI